jgi:hypothetical protein
MPEALQENLKIPLTVVGGLVQILSTGPLLLL